MTSRYGSALPRGSGRDPGRRGRTLLRLLLGHEPPAYAEVSRLTGMPLGSIGPTRGRYLDKLRRNLETAGLGAEAWR